MTDPKHIVIVGAGIGGLTLGIILRHYGLQVTILEQAAVLTEVGAGIQLAPNATRILEKFDLLSSVLEYANQPAGTIIRRYDNDEEIGPPGHTAPLLRRFTTPMLTIHRADLQSVLIQAARSAEVNLRLGARVEKIDPLCAARVTLTSGETVEGDVLVGADGIKSLTRTTLTTLLGVKDKIVPTGDAAYRAMIPRAKLENSPDLLSELDQFRTLRWIGPGGHIVAYPIRGNSCCNVVMIHAHRLDSDDESNMWTQKGEMDDLKSFYKTWNPSVCRLADCIDPDTLLVWPLNTRSNLPAWSANRTCLLGDACHPMLPYVAQGAGQSIEDAAVLGICLSAAKDIPTAFLIYEYVRKRRAELVQGSAAALRSVLHMKDGPEQEARDAQMRAPRTRSWKHPDLWADPSFQDLVWGHDVMAEAEVLLDVVGKVPF